MLKIKRQPKDLERYFLFEPKNKNYSKNIFIKISFFHKNIKRIIFIIQGIFFRHIIYKMQEENPNLFYCKKCDYSTLRNYDYQIHLKSKKHNKIKTETTDFCCNKCQKIFHFASGLSRHQKLCKFILNSNILTTLNERFKETKSFTEIIQTVRINSSFFSNYKTVNDYIEPISNILKEGFQKIPRRELPIFCIRNENPDIDVVYIRGEHHSWVKETKYDWIRQILIETEKDVKDDESKLLLRGFRYFERNIMNDIRVLFKKKVVDYYNFEREIRNEIDFYMNKITMFENFIEMIKINKEDFERIISEKT